jgi:hypothetical protein
MVRHHYGPWDHRYYQVLPFLEGRCLVSIEPSENSYRFKLTSEGELIAKQLRKSKEFAQLVEHMRRVKELLGKRTGNALKNLIYELFDKEVAQKELGEILR